MPEGNYDPSSFMMGEHLTGVDPAWYAWYMANQGGPDKMTEFGRGATPYVSPDLTWQAAQRAKAPDLQGYISDIVIGKRTLAQVAGLVSAGVLAPENFNAIQTGVYAAKKALYATPAQAFSSNPWKPPASWTPRSLMVIPQSAGARAGTPAASLQTLSPWEFTPLQIDTTQPIRTFGMPDYSIGGVPEQYRQPLLNWIREQGFKGGGSLGRFALRQWTIEPAYTLNPQVLEQIEDAGLREWAKKLFGVPTTAST